MNPFEWLLDKFLERAEARLLEKWKGLSAHQMNVKLTRLDIQWSETEKDEPAPISNYAIARFKVVENAEKLKETRR